MKFSRISKEKSIIKIALFLAKKALQFNPSFRKEKAVFRLISLTYS
jgi:hypothetical protein